MLINIEGLEFAYKSTPVLNNITLDIDGPQFVSIIGPNGVGKSTLIHCLNKILSPTKGVVSIDGKNVNEYTLKELAKKVGYVPYTSIDVFPLTVVDTVLMGRHPHSKWKSIDSDLEIVYETLKLMNIEHLAMRSSDELSAGQRQKVVLARGLVQQPRILLLDEPTSNLDIKHQMEVTRILKGLCKDKGIIVVMISHDLNIAAKYADKIIMMHEGGIFSVGVPSDVITEENIKVVYEVESKIITDEGRPHIILRDESVDSSAVPELDFKDHTESRRPLPSTV